MTNHDPEREDDLRALFQETREDADRVQLVKLRARAADVPARAQKSRRWLGLVPVFALAFAAAVALFVARQSRDVPERPVATLVQTGALPAPSATAEPAPAPTAVAESSAEPEEALPVLEPDEADSVAALDDPSGDDPLAALDEPAADDVDAWLSATSSFLEGG